MYAREKRGNMCLGRWGTNGALVPYLTPCLLRLKRSIQFEGVITHKVEILYE
uniref:Uncharacterized protein n=1 Tax=Oryza brachyantha TaxID=4533 RepID=J3KXS3_ORYBR